LSSLLRRTAAFSATAVMVLIVLLLSGCGSSDSSPTTSFSQSGGQPGFSQGGGPPGGVNPAALRQLRSCMKKQGVQVPSGPPNGGAPPSGIAPQSGQPPSGGPRFFGSAKARKAIQACRQYLPQGGPTAGAG
jgi:hypothetical protein